MRQPNLTRRLNLVISVAVVAVMTVAWPVSWAYAEPSATPTLSPDAAAAPPDYGWLWAVAGVMTVLLIYLGWRFLLGARK
ncbi:MAG: hypothetical protein LBV06_08875 [Propionibacteriaceae bacterium]|jgi:hypothetical protein|nr:hypothetical protein [Propionibacteriaceae bacterium]